MSYANAIRDIAPGSVWVSFFLNWTARIDVAAGGWVRFTPKDGAPQLYSEREFRFRFLPLYDREKIRSQFTMSLANLGEFRAYWLHDLAKIMVRSVSCQRQFRVPEGARLVGTWSAPCKVEDFFEALDAVILAPEPEQQKARERQ